MDLWEIWGVLMQSKNELGGVVQTAGGVHRLVKGVPLHEAAVPLEHHGLAVAQRIGEIVRDEIPAVQYRRRDNPCP